MGKLAVVFELFGAEVYIAVDLVAIAVVDDIGNEEYVSVMDAGGNNAFMMFVDNIANKPEEPEPIEAIMTVTVDSDASFEFDDFGKGWQV